MSLLLVFFWRKFRKIIVPDFKINILFRCLCLIAKFFAVHCTVDPFIIIYSLASVQFILPTRIQRVENNHCIFCRKTPKAVSLRSVKPTTHTVFSVCCEIRKFEVFINLNFVEQLVHLNAVTTKVDGISKERKSLETEKKTTASQRSLFMHFH